MPCAGAIQRVRSAGSSPPSSRFAGRTWLRLSEIQRVPLIVMDHELSRSPGRPAYVCGQQHAGTPTRVRNRVHVGRFEVEVQMLLAGHEVDRRIFRIDEFEMKQLRAGAN